MATLDELRAELARRKDLQESEGIAPTEFGRTVEAAADTPADVPTSDGQVEFDAIPISQRAGGRSISPQQYLADVANRVRQERPPATSMTTRM